MEPATAPVDVDVLIVGAGLSGIGTACHLKRELPHKSFAIIEARDSIGGTWDLFRYPGIRSDSDMFTLGFSFRPWLGEKSIADGADILAYVKETAAEYGVDRMVRFGQRMVAADWSSERSRWTVTVEVVGSGERLEYVCRWLSMCSGYYRYDEGYNPEFPGIEQFRGEVVHPQHWPDTLDYAGKRIVVIGSGATAITLVPAMAATAGHVTMVQRTPTYVLSLPARDAIADFLRRRLPPRLAHRAIRAKNVTVSSLFYRLSRRRPDLVKKLLRRGVVGALPDGFDVATHFAPPYNPWDQRLCVVPDGDLFAAISQGRASVVTDRIDTFTPTGLRLRSGRQLEADIVVTATGLNMQVLGGAALSLDGVPVSLPDAVTYKGAMLTGVPNVTMAIGYINASWALKCELIAQYGVRVLRHMDSEGYTVAVSRAPGPDVERLPLLDLTSGYVQRAAAGLPKRTTVEPWVLMQSYRDDVRLLRQAAVDDGVLAFSRSPVREGVAA